MPRLARFQRMVSADSRSRHGGAGEAWPINRVPAFQGVGDPFVTTTAAPANPAAELPKALTDSAHFGTIQLRGGGESASAEVPRCWCLPVKYVGQRSVYSVHILGVTSCSTTASNRMTPNPSLHQSFRKHNLSVGDRSTAGSTAVRLHCLCHGDQSSCTLAPRQAVGLCVAGRVHESARWHVPPGTAGAGGVGVDAAGAERAWQGAAAALAGVGAAGGAGRAECRRPDGAQLGPGGLQPPGRTQPWCAPRCRYTCCVECECTCTALPRQRSTAWCWALAAARAASALARPSQPAMTFCRCAVCI